MVIHVNALNSNNRPVLGNNNNTNQAFKTTPLADLTRPGQTQLNSLLGTPPEATDINVVKAFFVEVPPENSLHYRPIEIKTDLNSVNYLKEVIHNSAGQVTPASVREVARNIIAPSRQSRGEIGIAESWGSRRLAFFIMFEERTRNLVTQSVITGYTNHADVAQGMANTLMFDPNMLLYVSSHLILSQTVVGAGRFAGQGNAQLTASNIIRPVKISTVSAGKETAGKTLRPTDVSSYISGMAISDNVVIGGNDASMGISQMGIASDRKNEISSQYLSKLIRTNIIGANSISNSNGMGNDQGMDFADTSLFNPAAAASGYAREYSLLSSNLMNELAARTSYIAAGFVYMSELQRLWPEINNVAHLARLDKRASTDNRNVGQDWSVPNQETIVAHALTHAIPAMMSSCLLTTIDFVATNQTQGYGMNSPTINVGIRHATGMFENESAVSNKTAMYEQTIAEDVLSELFRPGETFYVEGQFTLFGLSTISISLNGGQAQHNTFPNYAAALASSVIIANDNEGREKSTYAGQLINQLV